MGWGGVGRGGPCWQKYSFFHWPGEKSFGRENMSVMARSGFGCGPENTSCWRVSVGVGVSDMREGRGGTTYEGEGQTVGGRDTPMLWPEARCKMLVWGWRVWIWSVCDGCVGEGKDVGFCTSRNVISLGLLSPENFRDRTYSTRESENLRAFRIQQQAELFPLSDVEK